MNTDSIKRQKFQTGAVEDCHAKPLDQSDRFEHLPDYYVLNQVTKQKNIDWMLFGSLNWSSDKHGPPQIIQMKRDVLHWLNHIKRFATRGSLNSLVFVMRVEENWPDGIIRHAHFLLAKNKFGTAEEPVSDDTILEIAETLHNKWEHGNLGNFLSNRSGLEIFNPKENGISYVMKDRGGSDYVYYSKGLLHLIEEMNRENESAGKEIDVI